MGVLISLGSPRVTRLMKRSAQVFTLRGADWRNVPVDAALIGGKNNPIRTFQQSCAFAATTVFVTRRSSQPQRHLPERIQDGYSVYAPNGDDGDHDSSRKCMNGSRLQSYPIVTWTMSQERADWSRGTILVPPVGPEACHVDG
jgi:hypothetical protein